MITPMALGGACLPCASAAEEKTWRSNSIPAMTPPKSRNTTAKTKFGDAISARCRNPARIKRVERSVSSGGRPDDAIKCGEDAPDEAPAPAAGNVGIVIGFAELATLPDTDVPPAASATAWPAAGLSDAAQSQSAIALGMRTLS